MRCRMKSLVLALCIVSSLAAVPAHAQFHAYAMQAGQAVKLDGVADDEVWREAVAHDAFFETQPEDRIPAKVLTEVRLASDQRYLYIALKAFDPAPELIRAPFARRDKISNDQDYIALYLDPSGGSKGAQMIYINPQGAVKDGRFSDVHGEDAAPDFAFEAVAARFDGGWSAELRIPFSSIAYARRQASPWKLLVMRNMTRDQRYRMYSAPVPRSTNCTLCFAAPVEGLRDLPDELSWTATPQLVLNRARAREPGGLRTSDMRRGLSLDLKLRPDPATVIDATIHPDFSQVELDAPQLSGNTRFGLFVPEMRPFFLEGSDILQTPFRAIHTRAIGNPSWGARYTRREPGRDLTVLTAHDAGGGTMLLPSAYASNSASQDGGSQATIARANFKLGALAVGALGTDRTLDQGRGYNRVIGPDFNWQRTDGDRWRGQFLLSSTSAQPDGAGRLAAGPRSSGRAASLEWWHEAETWSAQVNAADVSDGFRADNGFFSQVGYRDLIVQLNDKRGKFGMLNDSSFWLYEERKLDTQGEVIYGVSAVGVWASGPYDGDGEIYVKLGEQSRIERGGPLFSARRIGTRIGISPGPVLARVQADIEGGEQVDVAGARLGHGAVLNLFALLRPSGRFELEPRYSRSWINGGNGLAGQRLYTEQAAQLNGIYHFSARETLRVIVQASHSRRDPALYETPVLASSTERVLSLVASHIAGLGTAAYAGLTLSDGEISGAEARRRRNEVFLKLSLQL